MKRLVMRAALFAISTTLLSSAAAAQDGAMWADAYGRVTAMQFGDGSGVPPITKNRTPAEMVGIFARACVATKNEPAAVAAALASGNPAFRSEPVTVPGSRKTGPIVLPIWRSEGVVISHTDGFFAAPNAQCNATYYVAALPDAKALEVELTAALGAAPLNAAAAVKKNGEPNRGYAPIWAGPGEYIIEAHVSRGDRYMPGDRVQLVLRAKAKSRS